MFFTIERNGSPYPLVAPIGAAVYCVVEDDEYNEKNKPEGKSRFMVAMLFMAEGETDAYDTMIRAKKTWPNFKWKFIAMNPGMQHMHDKSSEGELHGWFFRTNGSQVVAEEEAVSQFLTPMTPNQIQSTVVKGKLVMKSPGFEKAKKAKGEQ